MRWAAAKDPPPSGSYLHLGPDFAEMAKNMLHNPSEMRVRPMEVVPRCL